MTIEEVVSVRRFGFSDTQDVWARFGIFLPACDRKRPLILLFLWIHTRQAMRKSEHIFNLERRFLAIENEISETLMHCSTDDPMIADLKRRLLHLRDELNRLHREEIRYQKQH